MAYKSKYTGAEIEAKLDLVYNKYFNPVVPDEPIVPDEPVEPEPLPLGVFIQHVDGSLYTADEWTAKGFASADANGVAVNTETMSAVVAKELASESKVLWQPQSELVEGCYTEVSNYPTDYNGQANTAAIVAVAQDGAGYIANQYVFPNGAKGYLPTISELYEVCVTHITDVENAIAVIGGRKIDTGPYNSSEYWSSTQRVATYAYKMSRGSASASFIYDVRAVSKTSNCYVRPFCPIR